MLTSDTQGMPENGSVCWQSFFVDKPAKYQTPPMTNDSGGHDQEAVVMRTLKRTRLWSTWKQGHSGDAGALGRGGKEQNPQDSKIHDRWTEDR